MIAYIWIVFPWSLETFLAETWKCLFQKFSEIFSELIKVISSFKTIKKFPPKAWARFFLMFGMDFPKSLEKLFSEDQNKLENSPRSWRIFFQMLEKLLSKNYNKPPLIRLQELSSGFESFSKKFDKEWINLSLYLEKFLLEAWVSFFPKLEKTSFINLEELLLEALERFFKKLEKVLPICQNKTKAEESFFYKLK